MVMVRIAHIADTHLGYKQYNLEEREQDIYDALDEIASKILEESVDIVLHSGDLFDSWRPTARAYYEFKKFLNKLDKMKVKVYTILGDHDRPKKLGLPPHRLFEDKIEILGIASAEHRILKLNDEELFIAGISNLNRRYREVLLQELKKLDIQAAKYKKSILMLHQAIDKFAPEEVFEVKLEELPRNFKYIAMGHLHTRVRATHGNGELAYPGSIEILRRDEITGYEKHGKGFYLIDIEGDEARISEVKLNVRPQIKAKLSYAEFERELIALVNSIQMKEKLPIIHAIVQGREIDRQSVHQALFQALANKSLHFRVEFEEEREMALRELKPGSIAINQILKEYLQNEEIAELGFELYKVLRYGDVEEARKIAEEYFQRGEKSDIK